LHQEILKNISPPHSINTANNIRKLIKERHNGNHDGQRTKNKDHLVDVCCISPWGDGMDPDGKIK